jgi:hypothetical protein
MPQRRGEAWEWNMDRRALACLLALVLGCAVHPSYAAPIARLDGSSLNAMKESFAKVEAGLPEAGKRQFSNAFASIVFSAAGVSMYDLSDATPPSHIRRLPGGVTEYSLDGSPARAVYPLSVAWEVITSDAITSMNGRSAEDVIAMAQEGRGRQVASHVVR